MALRSKPLYVLIAVTVALILTNPTLRDLKEHVKSDKELSAGFKGRIWSEEPRRVLNFWVCSTFKRRITLKRESSPTVEHYDRLYLGIAKNFIFISETEVK